MKRRLLLPLIMCALVLAGCYRQAEEPFQQVDSSEVEQAATPLELAPVTESGATSQQPADDSPGTTDSGDGAATIAPSGFITPEPPPGQVEQPVIVLPTRAVVEVTTGDTASTGIFILPTPTRTFEESLDPDDECVYSVLPGDNLFRLSQVFETTVEDFFEVNELDSDALQIGQLLVIPGCVPTVTEEVVAEPTVEATIGPVSLDESAETGAVEDGATEVAALPIVLLPEGLRIHVVSAGETLVTIALRYGIAAEEIIAANDLADPDQLNAGQELVIPDEPKAPEEPEEEPIES